MGICLSTNYTTDTVEWQAVDNPMTEDVFNRMSKIPGFNAINGHNYPEYLIKWLEGSTNN
jgi:hypothetical protein